MLLPMKDNEQKRNPKGKFLKIDDPKKFVFRLTEGEKEWLKRVQKITLTKEELALARPRAKERLPRRKSKSQRITGMENLPRLIFPQYFSEEVFKIKLEKLKKI